MPTVADLERLDALVTNLTELNDKQRGELIEAETWNRLVTAVIEIGRVSLAGEETSEVARHSHSDQVSLEWLDPKLRTLILEGGGADPATTAQMSKLQRELESLNKSLEALSDRIDRIQGDVSGVATRDVERETMVGTALRKLDGVFDARDDVASLRSSLRLIEGQVRTAADLSLRLQDNNGEEIDFNGISGRVSELEAFRSSLTLPAGGTFDAQSYSRDLAQLRAELVTEEELTEALDNVKTGFEGDLRDELLEGARSAALEGNADALAALGQELRDGQAMSIRQLEESIPTRVDAATGDLSEQILVTTRTERDTALTAALTDFGSERDADLDRRLGTMSQDVTRQIESLSASVDDDISRSVSVALDERLGGLDSRIAGLERQDGQFADDLKELSGSIDATGLRLETVQRELQAADSRLSASLTERIVGIESSLDGRIADANLATRTALRAEMDGDMAALRDQLTLEMTRTLREVAKTEVDIATTRMRGEMTDIAQAEIESGLEAIRAESREASAVSDARLAGMVSSEVRRATADLDERIKLSVESFQPQREREVTRRNVVTPREPIAPISDQ